MRMEEELKDSNMNVLGSLAGKTADGERRSIKAILVWNDWKAV